MPRWPTWSGSAPIVPAPTRRWMRRSASLPGSRRCSANQRAKPAVTKPRWRAPSQPSPRRWRRRPRMPRAPLAVLARLHKLETEAARRRLGEAYGRLAQSQARAEAAATALHQQGGHGRPADYGTWLTRGLAERNRAHRAQGLAETTATAAAGALGEA